MEYIMTTLSYLWNIIRSITIIDIIDIAIVAFVFYYVYKFIRERRAGKLAAGILILLLVLLLSDVLKMHAMQFLMQNVFQVGVIAVIIVFQPELRSALEKVGAEPFKSLRSIGESKAGESSQTIAMITSLTEAVCDMSLDKTGALIVLEKNTPLNEYERTGITLDSVLTSQLLINIFEKNTPLHDGAVIVRGDRIVSATCYLPLSDNLFLSKELGTRHRAAVGISEVTDSLTIVVSEETGAVSVASQGELKRNLTQEELKSHLAAAQDKTKDTGRFRLWKGRVKRHEKAADK